MKIIGFFNNKGGVGKTSLVYHIAYMLGQLRTRVIAADLDPQANLTSLFLTEDRLEELFAISPRPTLLGAVSQRFRGVGDVQSPVIEKIDDQIGLLPGDLELSKLEDDLSGAWPDATTGMNAHSESYECLHAGDRHGRAQFEADVALVDVRPNRFARSSGPACLRFRGRAPRGRPAVASGLAQYRTDLAFMEEGLARQTAKNPDTSIALPAGGMRPVGYVVMRHSVTAGRPARAYGRWIARIPEEYREYVLASQDDPSDDVSNDPNCLALLKDYRSLMPMGQESRKPMFLLRPADGAFGGHQQAVQSCYADFKALTLKIMERCKPPLLSIPPRTC